MRELITVVYAKYAKYAVYSNLVLSVGKYSTSRYMPSTMCALHCVVGGTGLMGMVIGYRGVIGSHRSKPKGVALRRE